MNDDIDTFLWKFMVSSGEIQKSTETSDTENMTLTNFIKNIVQKIF